MIADSPYNSTAYSLQNIKAALCTHTHPLCGIVIYFAHRSSVILKCALEPTFFALEGG
jgi:hypothetical protein